MQNNSRSEQTNYQNLITNSENQLLANYSEMVKIQNDIDVISTAISGINREILKLEIIHSKAYDKRNDIIALKGLRYQEICDYIDVDVENEYLTYDGKLREIRYNLNMKKQELETRLEELRSNNSSLCDMINVYSSKMKMIISEM